MPYRKRSGKRDVSAPRDQGIVGELIDQFADSFAFYRELIQNALDAGTERIDIKLAYDHGTLRVSVQDHGVGMTQEVLEDQLLVLFKSGKEGRDDMIGKFGVGFVSVLAVEPTLVSVRTSIGEGPSLTLELHADHSYEIFESGGTKKAGTTVTLHLDLEEDAVPRFAKESRAAIKRWCRHAAIPIHFQVFLNPGEEPTRERLDEDFALDDAFLSHQEVIDDTTIITGLGQTTYGGFYRQGLMLYEETPSTTHRFMFKASDRRLEHTLSRDNVKQDATYYSVLKKVNAVGRRLGRLAVDELKRAVLEDPEQHARLTVAALGSEIVARELIPMRLLSREPASVTLAAFDKVKDVWLARHDSLLTDALTERGALVLDGTFWKNEHALTVIARGERARPFFAEESLTYAGAVDLDRDDEALLEAVGELLSHTIKPPRGLHFARFVGEGRDAFMVTGPNMIASLAERTLPWVIDATDAKRSPFAVLRRPPIALNTRHEAVKEARRVAEDNVLLAAEVLCRLIFLEHEELTEKRERLLTEHMLEKLLSA